MKLFKKIITFVLLVAFVVSSIPFSNGVEAEAKETVTIYASKVKTEKSRYYEYDSDYNKLKFQYNVKNVFFVIDEDVYIEDISTISVCNLTIKGDKKLSFYELNVSGSYTQESGTNVYAGNRGISVLGSANIKSGANLNFDTHNYTNSAAFYVKEDLYISGNINIKSSNMQGIKAFDNLYILGGEVHVDSDRESLYSENINISGGKVYLKSKKEGCIHSYDSLSISGGYVECLSEGVINEGFNRIPNIYSEGTISISEPMYIKTPSNTYILENDPNSAYHYTSVAYYDNRYPKTIIITNNAFEEAEKKAAEAAAQKAAEETKKAAEESKKNANGNKYSNEWVNGKWYNADGTQTYTGTLEWKCNSNGWWVEDTSGWYPVSQWQKIDGKWYYFLDTGYMDYSEYRDGYWLGADGAIVDGCQGEWKGDSTGWWFEDKSGWYPQSQWVWINGSCYYFEANGYLATNKYVDGYWVGSDGACQ